MSAKSARKNSRKPAGGGSVKQPTDKRTSIDGFFSRHGNAGIWLSGLLPMAGLLIIYACMGIFPFGEKTVANVDMMQQYIPFYASLKNALFGGHGLLYSQSLGMGSSYWGLIGYYLASPFAWFSLPVPNERLADYMALQELVRAGLTGCSFGYFYSRKFGRNDLTVPLLSTCYALCSFMLLHLCTVIWGGCLMLLPLIVWGLEELLRGKKPWLYLLCLSAAGISNYYISLMIGIYLVLYAAAFLFAEGYFADTMKLLRRAGMFAACSLLAVGVSAVTLLPSALLIGETGNAADQAASGFWAVNPLLLLRQMLFHADSRILGEASPPLLYCSVFAALCLPLFFLCRGIPARIKAAFGGLTGFLALSLAVNGLNYLWHGAHIPNDLPYRFAFLLVFTLLVMAGYTVENFTDISQNAVNAVLGGMMAVAAVAYFAGGRDTAMLAGTLLMAVCYTAVAFLLSGRKLSPSLASALALGLVFAELTTSGVTSWRHLEKESGYTPRSKYISHCRRMETIAEDIAVSDSDIYRTGMLTEVSFNNNALTGLSGLSCFSSTNNGGLMDLLGRAGYDSDGRVVYYYKSFSPLMDSVLNMKYVVYNADVGDPPYLTRVVNEDGYAAYRNKLCLPRAFAASEGLTDWNTSQDNPFEVQNDFVRRAVSDSDLTVYESLSLVPDKEYTFGAAYGDGTATFASGGGRLVLGAVSESRRHMYVYIDCPGASSIQIAVGERQYSMSDRDNYVADLGWWGKGETFAVSVTSPEAAAGRIYAALLDESALEGSVARLSSSPAAFSEYSETAVACKIKAEKNQMLFTSIPFEKGWKVTVNGKPTKAIAIGGGLIGVPLEAGENTVELRYTVRGLAFGAAVSLMAAFAAILLLWGKETADQIKKRLKI